MENYVNCAWKSPVYSSLMLECLLATWHSFSNTHNRFHFLIGWACWISKGHSRRGIWGQNAICWNSLLRLILLSYYAVLWVIHSVYDNVIISIEYWSYFFGFMWTCRNVFSRSLSDEDRPEIILAIRLPAGVNSNWLQLYSVDFSWC